MAIPITEFAPAERVAVEVVQRQAKAVAEASISPAVLNSASQLVFILNQQRQIIFASQNWRAVTGGQDSRELLGKRPGEVLGCLHAGRHPGGCGASEYCRECGAARAILKSLAGSAAVEEFRITRIINCNSEALDLLVHATPFKYGNEVFSIFSVSDISHQKRRRALEQIFFHDVINGAGGLEGLAELLAANAPQAMKTDLELLKTGLHSLLEQIFAQRDLAAAENGELSVNPRSVHTLEVLQQLVASYRRHPAACQRCIQLDTQTADATFTTDPILLNRVLGNLIKNALEASPSKATVKVGCEATAKKVSFWVHNPTAMPREVQLQIFTRSFSTKGEGHGLGTYSVKLLTEKYLRGSASFTSSPGQGTRFSITLPVNWSPAKTKRAGN